MSEELIAHPSVAETISKAAAASKGNGLFDLNAITKVIDKCPDCGGEIRVYIEPTPETPPRCPAFCMREEIITEGHKKRNIWNGCGYRELKKRVESKVQVKYDEALKTNAIGFMKKNSLMTDDSIWKKTLNSYKTTDQETTLAKSKAEQFVSDLLVKNTHGRIESNAHVVLTGTTGSGKTHLSMGMIYRYLKESGYTQKVMLVSYRELLEQLKFAMNDEEARKKITGEIMTEIKRADLVLVDDIGAQLGKPDAPTNPTPYDIDTMSSLFEARLDKATIITMNLSANEIKRLYGERVYSRIVNNVGDRFIKFEKTPDKRITGI